jgi:hypothetical protein
MITVYEIKANGFVGASKQIDPRKGVGSGWTYTPPPAEGPHKWEGSQWVAYDAEPPPSMPGPDTDAMATDARTKRTELLAACDWTQVADAPVDREAWAAYRQALRDITAQEGFPLSIDWPALPV